MLLMNTPSSFGNSACAIDTFTLEMPHTAAQGALLCHRDCARSSCRTIAASAGDADHSGCLLQGSLGPDLGMNSHETHRELALANICLRHIAWQTSC